MAAGSARRYSTRMRILTISGSLRAVSSNGAALDAAALLAGPGAQVQRYEGLAELPHFNPDLDVEPAPPAVARLRDALAAADAVLLSVPEYAHGVPGAFKNALDWVVGSGELVGKPVGLLNTSPRAMHAQTSLQETLRTMSADLRPDACVEVPISGRVLQAEAIAVAPALAAPIRAALDALAARPA